MKKASSSAAPANPTQAPASAPPAKPRGRPRSFDRAAALEAATEVFWSKGYESTSINDLTEAMGINPPSLYAAFGDKERLFMEAVTHYAKSRAEPCPEVPTAREFVAGMLAYKADLLTGSGHPRGCMLMVALFTAANTSPALQKLLQEKRNEAREHIRRRIRQGIADGDVPADTDAAGLADFYTIIITGMSQQARDGATRKSLLATVERAMQIFPQAPGASHKRKARASATA